MRTTAAILVVLCTAGIARAQETRPVETLLTYETRNAVKVTVRTDGSVHYERWSKEGKVSETDGQLTPKELDELRDAIDGKAKKLRDKREVEGDGLPLPAPPESLVFTRITTTYRGSQIEHIGTVDPTDPKKLTLTTRVDGRVVEHLKFKTNTSVRSDGILFSYSVGEELKPVLKRLDEATKSEPSAGPVATPSKGVIRALDEADKR